MSHEHRLPPGTAASPHDHAFLLGIGLNLAFVALEAVFGVAAHSTALLADAAHNLSDVLGLAIGRVDNVPTICGPT